MTVDGDVPTRRAGPANCGMVALALVLGAFMVWGVRLAMRPAKGPEPPPGTDADRQRTVELVQEAAGSYRDDPEARSTCLGALRVIPPDARRAGIVDCVAREGAEGWKLREAAAYFAAEFVSDDPALFQSLAELAAAHPTPNLLYALARSGREEAVAAIAPCTAGEAEEISLAESAVWALGICEAPGATQALLDVIATAPSRYVGWTAARAVGYRGDSRAYRPLVNLLDTIQPAPEPSAHGERAALALGYLGRRSALRHLREAAHRMGDYWTPERLALAFALCRLRPPDDYNFWVLAEGARDRLPMPPYRDRDRFDQAWTAIPLIVQLNDPRVRHVFVEASQHADGGYATLVLGAFETLGLEPRWDDSARAYVLSELPPDKRPPPPWENVPPWPFSQAGRPSLSAAE